MSDQIRIAKLTAKTLKSILASRTQRKHLWRWLRSRETRHLIKARTPWLTFDATDFVRAGLHEGSHVFEWGSGGSTLFWIKHGTVCTSVEHDPGWYGRMRLCISGAANVDYRLVLPEQLASTGIQNASNPDSYASKVMPGCTFRAYACQIDEFPAEHFDIVLVDGRARPSCLAHSWAKVKAGGMLVLDNANRKYYLEQTSNWHKGFAMRIFEGFGPISYAPWRTDVYIKLAAGTGENYCE